jgi:GDP-L-fucose synthase
MKHLLLTGATGFIGRNILPLLRDRYNITAPSRTELDLLDADAVKRYIGNGCFDVVLHLATPTGHNPLDASGELFERSIRVFTALVRCASSYGKMIYLGSGAEYGKHRPLVQINEEKFREELPKDAYGLSRYVMSELAEKYTNIINLRLFGCHGPDDQPHKLIPSIITQANTGNTVTLRQDCQFDFLYVTDIVDVLTYFIKNDNLYSSYNLCSGERLRIVTIAEEVCRQMGINATVICQESGLNHEYTGSNARLLSEIPDWRPLTMKESISNILKKKEFYENQYL